MKAAEEMKEGEEGEMMMMEEAAAEKEDESDKELEAIQKYLIKDLYGKKGHYGHGHHGHHGHHKGGYH